MFPQFALKFEHSFHIEVTSRPKSIEIELLKEGQFLTNTTALQLFPFQFPGHSDNDVSATALSPNESYIQFSLIHKVISMTKLRKNWGVCHEHSDWPLLKETVLLRVKEKSRNSMMYMKRGTLQAIFFALSTGLQIYP